MPKKPKFDPRRFSDAPLLDTEIDPPVVKAPKDKRSPWLGSTIGKDEPSPESEHKVVRPEAPIQPPVTPAPKSAWGGGTAGGRITESPSRSKGQSAGQTGSHPENAQGRYALQSTATNKKVTALLKKDPEFKKDFYKAFPPKKSEAGASAGGSAKKEKHSYKKIYK